MKEKKTAPIDFFWLALLTFGGFGLELLLQLAEPEDFSADIHRLITALLWFAVAVLLYLWARRGLGFDLLRHGGRPAPGSMAGAVVLTVVGIALVTLLWGGFKPLLESRDLGGGGVFIQYLYYLAESALIILAVVFGQRCMDGWTRRDGVTPWGGIFLALTWGLMHLFTQDLLTGIGAILFALMYGEIYNLCGKRVAWAGPMIVVMFLL